MKTINRVYAEYNKKYFEGTLPKIPVGFKRIKDNAYTLFIGNDPAAIVLNRYLLKSGRLARIVLLHEMAHVKAGADAGEGPSFQKEIHRLYQKGAYKGLL
jgi:hypothetical protein